MLLISVCYCLGVPSFWPLLINAKLNFWLTMWSHAIVSVDCLVMPHKMKWKICKVALEQQPNVAVFILLFKFFVVAFLLHFIVCYHLMVNKVLYKQNRFQWCHLIIIIWWWWDSNRDTHRRRRLGGGEIREKYFSGKNHVKFGHFC